jgi:hypothetical protein
MGGKVVEQVAESAPTDRYVQVRSLLIVTAVGVVAIAAAVAVTTHRHRAAPTAPLR